MSADRVNKHGLANKNRSIFPGASEFQENQTLCTFHLAFRKRSEYISSPVISLC